MNVTFYSGFSKRKNSTLRPSGGTTLNVVLKDNTSLMRPSFLVSSVTWSWNYCTAWQKYYYITDIVAESNGTFRVECEIDVLATYKISIGNYTTLISRSASDQDLDVMDTIYPAKCAPENMMSQYSSPGMFTSTISNGTFIMATTGNHGLHIYAMNASRFASLCYWLFPALGMDYSTWSLMTVGQALAGGQDNILKNVVSLKWLPITYSAISSLLTATSETYIGNWTMPHANSEILGGSVATIGNVNLTFPDRPDGGARGKWLYQSPFAEYAVYIPPFGRISVDGAFIYNSGRTVYANIMVDLIGGNMTMRLYYALSNTAPRMIGVYNCNVACDMAAGGASYNFGGVASAIAGAAVAYAEQKTAGVVGNIASAVVQSIPGGSQIGGGVAGAPPDITSAWFAYVTYWDPIDENRAELGRPLGEVRQISSLSGYIQCADAHCPIMGHESEMQKVDEFLNSGFFYE